VVQPQAVELANLTSTNSLMDINPIPKDLLRPEPRPEARSWWSLILAHACHVLVYGSDADATIADRGGYPFD
jgi:hypothetical protein